MSMDIINKYVECITDFYSELTKGQIYEVVYEFVDCIVVTNDLGYRKKYPIDTFRKLTNIIRMMECVTYVNRCNK